ncbi:hypothetical protein TW65_91078 [Stemphylium lycopersici]|nr:hypothetical protein TW65_91078 [Stemphylium lycopersici]
MRLTQAAVVAILAFTAAAKPIAIRSDDVKAMQEYEKCCEQRDKGDYGKVCVPPMPDTPEHPKEPEHPKPEHPKEPEPEHPKYPEEPKPEHPKEPEQPKPEPEHPKPEHPKEPEPDHPNYNPHPAPAPAPAPEPHKPDNYGYYTFGEEISLKCEHGKIVVKGMAL